MDEQNRKPCWMSEREGLERCAEVQTSSPVAQFRAILGERSRMRQRKLEMSQRQRLNLHRARAIKQDNEILSTFRLWRA